MINKNIHCLVCQKENLIKVADLKTQPLANNLKSKKIHKYESFPLGLNFCSNCTHLQLTFFVNPSKLFNNYSYASGTSNTLKNYFSWFASELEIFKMKYKKKSSTVLEIGSNDGSLLDELKNKKFHVTGIDPASNLCKIARQKHNKIINDYYPSKLIETKYDFIIAQNVFAHNPNPKFFLQSILNNLTEQGVAIIQTSQAMMFEDNQFDTIYHEHYSFFSYTSMLKLVNTVGGFLNRVLLVDIHGGSFLFIITKVKMSKLSIFNNKKYIIKTITKCRRAPLINNIDFFQLNINKLIRKLYVDLIKYKKFGFSIVFVGAAAKAIVILNLLKNTYSNIPIDIIVDEAVLKINKYIPNVGLQIKSLDFIKSVNEKKIFVISAWNFKDELTIKILKLVGTEHNRILTYYPTYSNQKLK